MDYLDSIVQKREVKCQLLLFLLGYFCISFLNGTVFEDEIISHYYLCFECLLLDCYNKDLKIQVAKEGTKN